MGPNILLPSNADLQRIERVLLPTLTMDDPAFEMFPGRNVDAVEVMWEQEASFAGLMAPRGQNGNPSVLNLTGGARYVMTPSSYGEATIITETDLENARKYGAFNTPLPEDDLVYKAQDHLLNRLIDRQRYMIWTLLSTGTYLIQNQLGGQADSQTYPFRTYTAPYTWATYASAQPLQDLRNIKPYERGYSTSFGRKAKIYANVTTCNNLLNNQNQNDLAGKRKDVGASFLTIEDFNKVSIAQDLPQLIPYDKGYLTVENDPTSFQLFIPNGVAIVIGDRPAGQTIGEFQNTRNAVNEDCAPGQYTFVTDSRQTGMPVPWFCRVDMGYKGGPAVYFPSSIIIMNV